MGSPAWMVCPRKHFDTSGKSPAHFQHRAIVKLRTGRLTVGVFDDNKASCSVDFIVARGAPNRR
jgi:hypothetical protein